MLSIEEALKLVAEHAKILAPRRVPLLEAAELVLAEDITSDANSPPYDKALMDGYAVRSIDREPVRRILEEIPAGAVPRFPLTAGTASRIMTGAPMPAGADAVVPVEQTELCDDVFVRLQNLDIKSGQHVLLVGASMRAGDIVLRCGAMLHSIEIAILAEIGHSMVAIVPRPRVAVLPTGNELVSLAEALRIGQIRNSNGPMLLVAANRVGAETVALGIARDNRDDLKRWIEKGLMADVLLLSGGVSAGKFDLVPQVLAELGVEQVFHKVALRPGKPLWFGVKHDGARRVLVFALPGNPVSSLVCFELFVRPAIAAMAGRGFTGATTINAQLTHGYKHVGGRAAYLPAQVTFVSGNERRGGILPNESALMPGMHAGRFVEILPWQGSADLATLTRANALARLGVEMQTLEPGDRLDVIPL